MDAMPFPPGDPIPLPPRFARIKKALLSGREAAVAASWSRLLSELRKEIEGIASRGSSIIPVIDFEDTKNPVIVAKFSAELKRRGAAIVRNVVPRAEALTWKQETEMYLSTNPKMRCCSSRDPHLFGVYWTPAQIKGRAHPNVFATQRLAMKLWHSSDPSALLSTNFPVAYADRLRMQVRGGDSRHYQNAHVDGGSVERWEPDGYGRGGTYDKIWEGKWEEYDPWESSSRLGVTSDLYNGAGTCSMFRMFQGWLSISDASTGDDTLLLCPMLKLSTAYFLLRPFFEPRVPLDECPSTATYLNEANWRLSPIQTSVIQGALPSYTQELNDLLHPHLQLARSMVTVPDLRPGDYVLWHPDLIYAIDNHPGKPRTSPADATTVMYIPACPLTQTNALYLAGQRKAFLLGHPSPDFGGGRGERSHMGRPGVQDVNEAGGEDGLRAMGLLPWDEKAVEGEVEKEVLRMANGILFPDRYGL